MCVLATLTIVLMEISKMRLVKRSKQSETYQVDVFHPQHTSTRPLGRNIAQTFCSGWDLINKLEGRLSARHFWTNH